MFSADLHVSEEVATALREGRPVVALESTVIAHGLPWPMNREVACEMETRIREASVVPATIAVWGGRPTIGLTSNQLEELAQRQDVLKASRRDLATAVAMGKTAATTVAATMFLAHRAGIRVFATGGIGGAHRDAGQPWDISADLWELSRIPVAVVCAGAKSILDIPRTLEILESYSVPVIGFQTDTFPAFYLPSSGEGGVVSIDSPEDVSKFLVAHWQLGGAGVVVAQPIAKKYALDETEYQQALTQAEVEAQRQGIRGKALTPFLLSELAQETQGKSLLANRALLLANASLAAEIALAMGVGR